MTAQKDMTDAQRNEVINDLIATKMTYDLSEEDFWIFLLGVAAAQAARAGVSKNKFMACVQGLDSMK